MKRKKPIRKQSKQSISKLKKKAWDAFSLYIRQRDADENGIVQCITCSTKNHWKKMQASHAVPGRGNNILFDERGVYPACMACNIFRHGNLYAYIEFLEKKHGRDGAWVIIEDLKFQSRIPRKFTAEELQNLIDKYKSKISLKEI